MSLDFSRWERPSRGALFVVSGLSGTGKTTLIREALRVMPGLRFSVSVTSRTMRMGEKDGVDYHFVPIATFERWRDEGVFLEWTHIYGNFYGTPRQPVLDAIQQGESIILDIDVNGMRQVRRSYPEAITVFILPPSLKSLEARLRGRATDTEEAIQRRLREARSQLAVCDEYDHIVLNDDLVTAHVHFQAILIAHLLARSRRDGWVRRILQQMDVP